MKILFVSMPIEKAHWEPDSPNMHYPLGLAYLHSFLEQKKHEVKTEFLNNIPEEIVKENLPKIIKTYCPDYIGIQILTHNRINSYWLIEYVKTNFPKIKIVIGGIHVSVLYRQLVEKYPFVVACIGESETTLSEILDGKKLEDIKGICYFDKQIKENERRELIENLDSLPFPKHEIFFTNKKTTANILTSRGCPFTCSFCVLEHSSRRKVRYRSVENIINEITFLIKKFPQIDSIWIHDDAFFLNNKRAIEFCNEVIKNQIKIKFICSARFKPLTKELVTLLEQAGFTHVLFGLESGAEIVLENTHKKITKDDVREAVSFFVDTNIKITSFLIIGLPGETEETILETAKFVQELQKINYMLYDDIGVCFVYPGTEVYQIMKLAKKIDDSYWLTDKPTPFFTVEHSYEKLLQMKELLRSYISLPKIFEHDGFMKQKKLLPYIVNYSLKFNINFFNEIIEKVVKENNLTVIMLQSLLTGKKEELFKQINFGVLQKIISLVQPKR